MFSRWEKVNASMYLFTFKLHLNMFSVNYSGPRVQVSLKKDIIKYIFINKYNIYIYYGYGNDFSKLAFRLL